jgi:hypothetical protein
VKTRPLIIKPQEGFTLSFVGKTFFKGGWYVNAEGAQSLLHEKPAVAGRYQQAIIQSHLSQRILQP